MHLKRLSPLFLLLFLLPSIGAARQCGCDTPASFDDAYQKANIVFVGTCMDVVTNPIKGGLNILFQVDSSWKRGIEKVATVHTNSPNQCGYDFHRNERYVVFANRHHQSITTSNCEPNQLFEEAGQATIARLGPATLPGRPEKAWNLILILGGLTLAGMLFLAFVVLRKKIKK